MTDSAPQAGRGAAAPRWRRPLAAVAAVAILGAALGAYFGLRANLGGAAGTGANPPPRTQAALAYDDATGQLLLFGGLGPANKILDDTWSWDGHTWTQEHPATSPPARYGGPMAYDAQTHSIVMFGGVTATVWSGSGATGCAVSGGVGTGIAGGTAVPVGTAAPVPACSTPNGPTAAPLPNGPETWIWNGSDWHRVGGSQPPAFGVQMAADPASGHIVLVTSPGPAPEVGVPSIACPLKIGAMPNENIGCGWMLPRTETWIWREGAWHQPSAGPPGGSGQTLTVTGKLVTDPRSGHAAYFTRPGILACGVPGSVPSAPPPAGAPSGVFRCGLGASTVLPITNAWTESVWTGTSWSAPASVQGNASGLADLVAGAIAPDPARHRVVFLSSIDGATVTFDGAWHKATPRLHPPALEGTAMAYDAATGQVVVFGGGGAIGRSSETWTWDGTEWARVSGTITPSPPAVRPGAPGTAVPLPAQASPPKNLHPIP